MIQGCLDKKHVTCQSYDFLKLYVLSLEDVETLSVYGEAYSCIPVYGEAYGCIPIRLTGPSICFMFVKLDVGFDGHNARF